ncbi:MAG: hypothetical protein J0M18_04870, partial [Ignavibacteria bacterium]|nr:hypothetical protein [Ignavibacteria bacterium]
MIFDAWRWWAKARSWRKRAVEPLIELRDTRVLKVREVGEGEGGQRERETERRGAETNRENG